MYFVAPPSSSGTACQLHLTIEKQRYRMTSGIRQDILSQIYDVIQSDVALLLQMHKNINKF